MPFSLFGDIGRRIKQEVSLIPSTLGFLPEELKKTTARVGEFMPGRELAKGIGTVLALPEVERHQQVVEERQRELDNLLLSNLREARRVGDQNKVQRLRKVATQTRGPGVLESVLGEAPTARQVIASAGELALLAVLGYKAPFKVVVAPVTRVGKAIKVIKTVGREAVIGAGFFGAMKATERDATIHDIVRASEMGALFGGGVTVGAMGIGAGIGAIGRVVAPPISRVIQRAITGLEKAAAVVPEKRIAPEGTQIQKTLSYIGEPFRRRIAAGILKPIQEARKFKARLVDRFSAGARVEQRLEETVGRPLKESEKIYRDMRLLTSVSDAKAEVMVNRYLDDLAKYRDVEDKATAWITQLDFIDRAKLGQTVPGKQTLDELLVGLKKLSQEIGPDDMVKVAQVRRMTNKFNDRLLQMRVDTGLISQELVNTLRRTHPNYVPHNVIMAIDERAARGLSQSLNVAKTDIMKAIGSAKNIENPISATIQRTQIATRITEKNRILTNLIEAQEKFNIMPGMQKITSVKQKIPSGFNTINFFRNGIKETWAVPGDLVVAIKNLDAPLTPGWWKFLTFPQKVLKKGATQYNLSFTVPNKLRDKQTAALTANAFIEEIAKKTGVSPKALNLTSQQIKELYKVSGGYGSSIFREGESVILNKLQRSGVTKVISSVNPIKIVNAINEGIEQSTRMEVFKQALQRGLSPRDAAFASRNATIDFARMGTWMRPMNQAVPFLNARVQGFINLPKAFIASPEAFTRMQMYTGVYPTIAIHQHNRRYDSYKNISQYFKNRYWIIMIGETDSIDGYTGQPIKVPQFITIPKGEGQQLVSGPINYYLEKADGTDFRKTSEMIADVIGSASPMEFQQFDQANWLTTAISQFGPLATIATGLGFGKHPYFGSEIIPEARKKAPTEMQFRKYTPELTKELAGIMDVAPANLEFTINTFGGLPQDMQKSADLIYGVIREGEWGGHPISETPIGQVTQLPLFRRFVREVTPFRAPEMEFKRRQKEEIETEIIGEKLEIKDRAEEIFIEMMKKKTKDEKLNYLNSLGEEMTQEMKDKIMSLKKYRQSVGVLKISDSTELRARVILQEIDNMKESETSKEEIIRYLDKLEKAKILTPSVRERIAELKGI